MKTKVKLLHVEHFFIKSRTLITLLISKLNYSMRKENTTLCTKKFTEFIDSFNEICGSSYCLSTFIVTTEISTKEE